MIVRLLFFILVFSILWIIYRQFMKALSERNDASKESKDANHEENMVKCTECGTFIPQSHAIYNQNSLAFCSVEHKMAHQNGQ